MTNLLDRLAMRALGILPIVQPVPPPRFASAPTLDSDPARLTGHRVADPSMSPYPAADEKGGLETYLNDRRSGHHGRL